MNSAHCPLGYALAPAKVLALANAVTALALACAGSWAGVA